MQLSKKFIKSYRLLIDAELDVDNTTTLVPFSNCELYCTLSILPL